MMIFDSFSFGDIQNIKALLSSAVSEGITSVPHLSEMIDSYVTSKNLEMSKGQAEKLPRDTRLCPECGRSKMFPLQGVSEPVLECPACRYSVYGGDE